MATSSVSQGSILFPFCSDLSSSLCLFLCLPLISLAIQHPLTHTSPTFSLFPGLVTSGGSAGPELCGWPFVAEWQQILQDRTVVRELMVWYVQNNPAGDIGSTVYVLRKTVNAFPSGCPGTHFPPYPFNPVLIPGHVAWILVVNSSFQRMLFPCKNAPEVEDLGETPGGVTTQLRLWDFCPEQFQEANDHFLDIFVMDTICRCV